MTSLALATGGQVVKGHIESSLTGRGSASELLALTVADGSQHIDFFTLQDHIAADTRSDLLFAASGVGNGSTFRTIGVIFDRTQAGPVLGWTSAVAAYGAFVAPIVIGDQIKAGTPQIAMYGFAAFYAVCLVLNWWFYLRPNAYVKNP